VIRNLVLVGNLAVLLVAFGWSVAHKEQTLRDGRGVLLALAPVDPRSLIQGDYMRLDYALDRALEDTDGWPRDGTLVVRDLPGDGAVFVRRHDGEPLAPDEVLLRYRKREGRVRVGTDAYYFEEGQAETFAAAKFAELRVDAAGESVLVNMMDEAKRPLGPGMK
jgi:uncharacterized membrane-anchored protein